MAAFATTYKRLYDGVNYRLRTFADERFADYCRPTSIAISMTERCNARCIHCDIWKNRGPEKGLTREQWETMLGELRSWLGPVQVTFSGGEALMRPVTIDLVRSAVSKGLVVEVLTNGYWKNQERIEQLARTNPWRITVSLDGIGDTHSLIRGHEDFFDRTAESLATLQRVRDEDRLQFKIRLKTVVMRQNLDEVEEVARYASGKPGVDVFYQPIEQNYNTIDDARCLGEQAPALAEQEAAGRREPYLPARALQEPHAEPALERLDLLAEARLRDVQARRGAAEVELLGDGDEVAEEAELGEIHRQRLSMRKNNLFA